MREPFPGPFLAFRGELLTDSLKMRTTASLIVTAFFGREDAPPATPAGRWCSPCRVAVQLVGVLIPR
jgi:GMP synthase PP-ATPase subunit